MIRKGAVAKHRPILGVRELVRDDLATLRAPRQTVPVQKLRDSHHRVAWLFATGLRHQQVADITGYSLGRIRSLYPDPAFQELIAEYRKDVAQARNEAVAEFATLATGNMHEAEQMLEEKIARAREEGELLPTRELIAITADRMDRFGYGKKQTNVNVNVDFAAKLERTIARSGKTIDGSAVREHGPLASQGGPTALALPAAAAEVQSVPQPFRRRA